MHLLKRRRTISSAVRRPDTTAIASSVACVACATHRRPNDVPWEQHCIGCAVRAIAVPGSRSARA